MKATDIQIRKQHLIEDITKLNDPLVIAKVEELLRLSRVSEYEKNLKPMTTEQLQARIQAARLDIKEGRVISQEDLEKESENW